MKDTRIFGLLVILFPFLLLSCSDEEEKDIPLYGLRLSGMEVVIVPTGGSETIGLVFIPIHTTDKNIEWKSSDTDIVAVEDGVVTGIKEGQAIVEAIPHSNPNKKVSVIVVVNPIPIESLTLDREGRLDMEVDSVLKISAIIMPEDAPQLVEWISSNEAIASVSQEGEITALKGGEVLITARSISDATKSASVTINVSNPNEIILSQPTNATYFDEYVMNYPINFAWIKVSGVTDYVMKISNNKDDFTQAMTISLGNTESYIMDNTTFQSILDYFNVLPNSINQLYWSVQPNQDMGNISTNVNTFSVKRAVPLLDGTKFVGLPHSQQFEFSSWGTSDLASLWNNNSVSTLKLNIFYITNKVETYFGVDLGVKAKLSTFVYWGRRDQFFQLRHAKKLQLYGTNDANIANNPESPDSQWILLTETPFVSTRPSGGTSKPIEGDPDYEYALKGENYTLPAGNPAVRYVRVKCLETWGGVEGFWALEIAFRGIVE